MAEAGEVRRWSWASLAVAAVVAGALAAVSMVVRVPWQLWSTPRAAIFLGLPLLVALAGAVVLVRRRGAGLFLVYLAAAGLAVLAAEWLLAGEDAAREQASRGAARAGRGTSAEAGGVVPQLCTSMVDVARPPYQVDGRSVLPVGGMSRALLRSDPPWTSDERGFNNPAGLWGRAPVEIAVVGDSFTFGADVPFGAGFVDGIRARVPTTVNLGCGGNGPYSELAALAEYGPELKPRIVLWAFYEGNDLTKDVLIEAASPILTSYLKSGYSQGLAGMQPALDGAMRAHYEAQLKAKAARAGESAASAGGARWREIVALTSLRTRLGLRHSVRPEALAHFDKILARAKAIAAQWNGTIVVVQIPAETRYTGALALADANGYARRVRAVVEKHGIAFLDVATHLEREPNPRRLYQGHFTVEGYARTARIILDDLTARALLAR